MFISLYIFALGLVLVSSRQHNFYRKDYVYNSDYDSFVKLHRATFVFRSPWTSAFFACYDEGAELFYPSTENEWKVAKTLRDSSEDNSNITDVFVGIHDQFGLGEYITLSGETPKINMNLPYKTTEDQKCLTMNIESGIFSGVSCVDQNVAHSFICKKVQDVTCPTIDQGYKYVKELKKCYKVSKSRKTWRKALEICFFEGGMLFVPSSKVEAEIVMNIISYYTENTFHAGFQKLDDNEYYTLKGHKVQDSGLELTSYAFQSDSLYCGTTLKGSHDISFGNCYLPLPFICEMEINFRHDIYVL